MRLPGPDTKYMMLWNGAWRPVTNMIDQSRTETNIAMRATAAVLYIEPDSWASVACHPGDLVERGDRDPNARSWDYID